MFKSAYSHFALCLIATIIADTILYFTKQPSIGWSYGITVGLFVELTQAEYGRQSLKNIIKRFTSKDSLWDMLWDGVGIVTATIIKGLL